MIIKRVPDPRHSASVSTRIRKLTDYIVRPDLKRPREKCLYAASRGFISETLAAQQLEMVALATINPRAQHPITHYIMSWQDGEVPSAADVERAVDIFMAQLGIDGCQVIYGLHVDTDNLHLHICLNRVHPETERPIRINGGYDIEACHQAIARIEAEQGWAPEVHSRYIARGANVFRTGFESDAPDIAQKARDGERRTGNTSVQQQVHHALVEVLGYASTWAEFHAGLARFGIAYVKKGNGAVCVLNGVEVKPSSALRRGSIKALEKLFGPFQLYEPDEIDDEIMPIRWPEPARHCSIKGGAGVALGRPVDGFECRIHEGAAYYSRWLGGAIEFIDRGSEIEVAAFRDEKTVLAALHLASEKWPGDSLVIEGEPDFKRLVVRLAAREGLTLADPELQRQVEAERQVQARAVDIADARRSELAHVDQAIRHLGAERFEILQPAADRRRGNRASSLVARSPDARGFPTDSLASAIAEAEAKGIPSADLALVPFARDKVYLAFDHAADIDPSVGDKPIAFRLAQNGLSARHLGMSVLQPSDPDDALISGLIADHFKSRGDRISVRRDLPGALSLAALEQGVTLSSSAAVSACPALTELLQAQRKARTDTAALLDDIGLPSRQLLRETPEAPSVKAVPSLDVISTARLLRARIEALSTGEPRRHPSRIDADLAMQLRVIGLSREEVVAVIATEFAAAGRDDAWITPDLYAARIVDAAFAPAAAERYARASVYNGNWAQVAGVPISADPVQASVPVGLTLEARSPEKPKSLFLQVIAGDHSNIAGQAPAGGTTVDGAEANRKDVQNAQKEPESLFLRLIATIKTTPVQEHDSSDASTEAAAIKEAPVLQAATPVKASAEPVEESNALQGSGRATPLSVGTGSASIAKRSTGLEILAEGGPAVTSRADTPNVEEVQSQGAAPATASAGAGATSERTRHEPQPEPSPPPAAPRSNNVTASEKSRPSNSTVPGPDPLLEVSDGTGQLPSTTALVAGALPDTVAEPERTWKPSFARAEQDRRAEMPPEPVKPHLPIGTKSEATNLSEAKRDDQDSSGVVDPEAGEGEIPTLRVQSPALPPPTAPSPPIGATSSVVIVPANDLLLPKTDQVDQAAQDRLHHFEDPKNGAQIEPSREKPSHHAASRKPPTPQTMEKLNGAPPAGEAQERKIEVGTKAGDKAKPTWRDEQPRAPQSQAPSSAHGKSNDRIAPSKTVPLSRPENVAAPDPRRDIKGRLVEEAPKSPKKGEPMSMSPKQGTRVERSPQPKSPAAGPRLPGFENNGIPTSDEISEHMLIAVRRAAKRALQAEHDQTQAQGQPHVPSARDPKPQRTRVSTEINQRPAVAPTPPVTPDPPPPVSAAAKQTSPGVPSWIGDPLGQDIGKGQAGEPSQKGDRSEARTTQAQPPKAVQLPPSVPILEIEGNGSLVVADEAMRVLVERFPKAVRRAAIPMRGKTASLERVLDPALMVGTEKLRRADVALFERAQQDFYNWSTRAFSVLKRQERDWLIDPQHDHIRRVSHKLLLAQATMPDETLSMSDRQRAGWLMARSLPAIRHLMPPHVQSWFDREKEPLAQADMGALIVLTRSTTPAFADELEEFLEKIPAQELDEKETRVANLASEPPPPLENDEPALLYVHQVLVAANETKFAEYIRDRAPTIVQHVRFLKLLSDLRLDPIAQQIAQVFRAPQSARAPDNVRVALKRIGVPDRQIGLTLKIIGENRSRTRFSR